MSNGESASGARWWRCALQVAPYAYLATNGQPDTYGSEEAYNSALVDALVAAQVSVIGLADHWRVASGTTLTATANAKGLVVLPGFEATTKEGLHVLIHFDPKTDVAEIERRISECGIDATSGTSDACDFFFEDLLERAASWGAVSTAAHVTMDAGLLKATPTGRRRKEMWQSEHLHAVGISVPIPPQQFKQIIDNIDPQYARAHAPAVIFAADIDGPEDAAKECAATWLKMGAPTARGIDLAFRSADTRVSNQDPRGDDHLTVQSIRWIGGFLDEVELCFNQDLNVLVGGRGTGKSTVVESVRAALTQSPLTDRAIAHHQEMLRDPQVLGRGTKIVLTLGCVSPRPQRIRVERLLPGPAIVFDDTTGERLARPPEELAAGLDVYGQRELAEIADSGQLRTNLLRRFLPERTDEDVVDSLRQRLDSTRSRILSCLSSIESLDDELSGLPALEERLRLFDQAGVSEQLAAQAKHQTEGSLIGAAEGRARDALSEIDNLGLSRWFDIDFLETTAGENVGDPTTLTALSEAFEQATLQVAWGLALTEDALRRLAEAVESVRGQWTRRSGDIDSSFNRIQRVLTSRGADANEFLSVLKRTEDLQRKRPDRERFIDELTQLRRDRDEALMELEGVEAEELRRLQRVGRRVSERLTDLVRVSVTAPDDRSAVVRHLRSATSGRLDKVEAWINSWPEFTVRALAEAGRRGIEQFAELSGVTLDQAQRVTSAGESVWLAIEETQLTPNTHIELNVSPADTTPVWRPLARLSTGQKATALLLLLLLEEKGPLVIDQPEDDLDNQFIFAGIVPRLRSLKGKRQLIFSTHNANIPVLGDAELIAAMTVSHETDGPSGRALEENRGSIDEPKVRELVEELLEGGRRAFEIRRYRYGF